MSSCRICRGKLKKIINLGKIALVGNFFKKKKKLKKYKISLNFCSTCKHVQISEVVNPNLLFKKYLWETGISKSNINLIKNLISKLKKFNINQNSKVLEIASNDGSFLSLLNKRFKCFSIGIDPAKNMKKISGKKNFLSIIDYFNFRLSTKIKKKFKKFNFIVARNVLAHVRNPNEIFKGVNNLLLNNGIFIIEVPHLENIIVQNQYDNIFHEHVGFHSLKSIVDLSKRHNLKVFDVEKIESQGGSLRCYICKTSLNKKIKRKVNSLIKQEQKLGLYSSVKLKDFKRKILVHITMIQNLIKSLKNRQKIISVYGASGKGQALLQFCNLNNNVIDYVFDKSKKKQGCYTPGTYIKIKNPSEIKKTGTQYLLLLSWNIKKEIIEQEKKFIKNGGKFIIPFPSPRVMIK